MMFMRIVTALVILVALAAWLGAAGPALAVPLEADPGQPAAHGESAGHGGEGGINPLNVEGVNFKGDLALWTAVVFLLVLAILWKFAWGPIADGLTKRENRIHEEIASAERTNAEARRLLEDYQQKLSAAGEDVRKMLEEARREAEQTGAEIVQQARTAAQAERDRALVEIDTATTGALKELADRSATLAVELAGKIVGSRLDRAAHGRLIEQALAKFEGSGAGKNGPGRG
jgi:F-type H+-transporting ATPase subunit b